MVEFMNRLIFSILFFFLTCPNATLGQNSNGSPKAVVTSISVKKGSIFTHSNIKLKSIDLNNLPSDAVTDITVFLNRRAGKNLSSNQILSRFDILSTDRTKWTEYDERRALKIQTKIPKSGYGKIFYPIYDLPKGRPIEPFSIDFQEIEISKVPQNSIKSIKQIVGSVARHGINQGQPITLDDLLPSGK